MAVVVVLLAVWAVMLEVRRRDVELHRQDCCQELWLANCGFPVWRARPPLSAWGLARWVTSRLRGRVNDGGASASYLPTRSSTSRLQSLLDEFAALWNSVAILVVELQEIFAPFLFKERKVVCMRSYACGY
jgi:hypothetical protein